MRSRFLLLGLMGATALTALPAFADGDEAAKSGWSGSVSLTSDYRFRGISQTDRNPAVQGGLEYNGSQGLFAGVWASNVDFGGSGVASWELDIYAGYTHAISEACEATIKAIYYVYPEADVPGSDLDYFELIGSVSHDMGPAALSLELAYTPDYFGGTGSATSVSGGIDVPIMPSVYLFDGGIAASGHVGYQMFDDNVAVGLKDYVFYDVGISATAGAFTLDVRYVGTDISEVECGGIDSCESGVVVTGTLAFGG